MKILVIGLDCAAPELLLGDDRLVNFRRLMEYGCYGRLESVIPPITVPAWMCMSTSQDPGSLGVYGFRNRTDHSYDRMGIVNSGPSRNWRSGIRWRAKGTAPTSSACRRRFRRARSTASRSVVS
jgi:predicted AlkP superfamily phosphohydrolase/phosphomutase